MKLQAVAVLLLAANAVAQDANWLIFLFQYPYCSIPCLQSGNKASGCDVNDLPCICSKGYNGLLTELNECFNRTKPCTQADLNQFQTVATKLCAPYKPDSATYQFPLFNGPKNVPYTNLTATGQNYSIFPPPTGPDQKPPSTNQLPASNTTTSSQSPQAQHSPSLSGAAYTGIGVAAAATVFILVGVLVFLVRRRRKKQSSPTEAAPVEMPPSDRDLEKAAKSNHIENAPDNSATEMGMRSPIEMPYQHGLMEVSSAGELQPPVELEARATPQPDVKLKT